MRTALALLLLASPVVGFSAELVKRSKSKAVLNCKKSELVDMEVGEEIYLVDAADDVTELMVEKINGQMVTVSGPIKELESGIAYQVRMDKPTSRHEADEDDEGDDEADAVRPLQAELGYGKRWNVSKDDGEESTNLDTVLEVRFAFQPAELPLSLGAYFNRYTTELNASGARITRNDLTGMEYGLRLEVNQTFGTFMPFFGVRQSLHKEMSGTVVANVTDTGFFASQRIDFNYKYQNATSFDLGFRLVESQLGLFVLGKKDVKEKLKGEMHIIEEAVADGSRTSSDVRIKGTGKTSYDELTLGLWINF